MKHLMVDLETLGTSPDAAVISIGAVKFDLDSDTIDDDGFYASISIESNLVAGRRIDEDTLLWWLQQSKAAQAVFFEPKEALGSALESFADWLEHDKRYVWSNGADFDLPILAHAFRSHGMDVPWQFWNSRCVRTYKNLPCAALVPKAKEQGIKHNALHDAVAQARLVQSIHTLLKK